MVVNLSFCQRCGSKIPEENIFCPDCGWSVTLESKFKCTYKYVRRSHGRIHVHHVMANCNMSREESVLRLQKLKSMGYIGGNAKDGYWLSSEMPAFKEIIPEEIVEKVFSYLEEHREISLKNIGRDLNISIPMVKGILAKLEKSGKIKLQK